MPTFEEKLKARMNCGKFQQRNLETVKNCIKINGLVHLHRFIVIIIILLFRLSLHS